jgi:NTP pyrophosphatase (non-canonical NTP hydrolase)
MNTAEQQFVESFNILATDVYATANAKGWWDDRNLLKEVAAAHSPELEAFAERAIAGMVIALQHSELSEALEFERHGNGPDDKIPQFSGVEAELADVIIRIMDMAKSRQYRVAEAIVAKMAMNKTRERLHGGKAF